MLHEIVLGDGIFAELNGCFACRLLHGVEAIETNQHC